MVTKLFCKPHYFHATSLCHSFLFLNNKPNLLSLSTTTKTCFCYIQSYCSTEAQLVDPTPISHGPSLHKGTNPSHRSASPLSQNQKPNQQPEENDTLFDEENFTRVFDISALRVPSKNCFTLENRLRGHLLNWPRIRNIARVPGDEVAPEIAQLLEDTNGSNNEDEEEDSLVSLRRRIYGKDEGDGEVLSPVLYRDKLVKTFNSRGFVKFRNLAKISRPKRKRKKEEEEEKAVRKRGVGKSDFAVVEVVEDDEEEEEGLKNLIGEEFRRKKWRGSTRLLLLDEGYAGKGVDELPEAIKVAVPTLW